ncbi:acyl-CoA carboxylase epsilon subunit [Amycolatopsis rifamycinica]|uniref:Acetyl-CoA carboxylase n=1 Tax=Amycolatopsis rifamycinica TaxID=287986 RepID=A0A066U3S6_9PSEU|nr:acyl-CoA carboxylase epsilon subunit [Amycolatopsis rifamycinica]KDN18878.1 hypothetical protein DV20_28435 [Amycolatopsis rifamycinica]
MAATEPAVPGFRVVRGQPDDVELAALVAALLVAAAPVPVPAPARPAWADPAWRRDAPLVARPGAWRLSGLPR